ncbi:MAG: hypothetical protein HWD58_04445 [Bacteroidota bacterium]|nr:MAG: hypothetical protein HWD58_04445 [Bacteroidota bacterium]
MVDIPYTKSVTLPEVPALPLSLPFEHTDTFATLVDEFISPYGFTKADILSVTPVSMNVTIDNSSPQTFNFVDDSAKVYVDAYNGTNPTLVAYVKIFLLMPRVLILRLSTPISRIISTANTCKLPSNAIPGRMRAWRTTPPSLRILNFG